MVTHHQLRLDLLDSLKCDADNDDNRSAADSYIAQAGGERTNNQREQCNNAEEQCADKHNLGKCLGDEVSSGLAGTNPAIKPPFFFRLLAISTGLNWIDA